MEIHKHPSVDRWIGGLPTHKRLQMEAVLRRLGREGAALGPPHSKAIQSSRHKPAMRELRVPETGLRALYAVDPRGRAVVLTAGDKTGRWTEWYDRNVPRADHLYDVHLANQRTQPWARTRTQNRSIQR
jgi:hypothetical protein